MALGLPAHLVQDTLGQARGLAGRTIAIVALGFALAALSVLAWVQPSLPLLVAFLAVGGFLVVTVIVLDDFSLGGSIAYMVVGTAATFLYSCVVLLQPVSGAVAMFILALPKIALVVVGGGTRHYVPVSVLWAVLGWGAGEIAVIAATSVTTMVALPFDHVSFSFLLLVLLILVLSAFSLKLGSRPHLNSAARAEEIARVRAEVLGQASALLHDVVLSDLAAIALMPDGEVDESVRARFRTDLEQLIGQEWIPEGSGEQRLPDAGEEGAHPLGDLVASFADSGLAVAVSGDESALGEVAEAQRRALLQAVEQALVNVQRHARVDSAELYLAADASELTVMIVDSGIGFDPADVALDRLGVRQSIEGRMAAAGGSGVVWSSPGTGTSVVLRMPVREEAAR